MSQTKLTYDDYCLLPDDGQRHEIIDGEHFVNPAPGTYHQTVSRKILFQLFSQIELTGRGEVYNAPTDLQLSEHDVVQPDLVIVSKQRQIITPSRIQGTPDLVVEILSPSTGRFDCEQKKQLYQRAGVPEYWIVDPAQHVVEQYVLQGADFVLRGSYSDEVELHVLAGIQVDLTQVW